MKQTSLYKKYVYEVFKNICILYVYEVFGIEIS